MAPLVFDMSRLDDAQNRRTILSELLRPVANRLEQAGAQAAAQVVRDAASELLHDDARLSALDEAIAEKRRRDEWRPIKGISVIEPSDEIL